MTDDDFDRKLKRMLRAEADSRPLALKPATLRARAHADAGGRWRLTLAAVAGAAGMAVTASVVAFVLVTRPALPPSAGVTPSGFCDVSPVASHGTWWKEIGGPGAFFNAESTNYFRASPYNWLLITRFDPAPAPDGQLSVWADRLGTTERVDGTLNSPMDPGNIYKDSVRAPQLPGGWYLFEQRFPLPGCWRLSAAVDGQVVATATLSAEGTTAVRLPTGIFMTRQKVDEEPCYAFELTRATYKAAAEIRAWWWDQGESGECRTRTSDVVASSARVVPEGDSGYEVTMAIPLMNGATHEIRVALYSHEDSLAGIDLSAANAPTFFTSVPVVNPSFAPVN